MWFQGDLESTDIKDDNVQWHITVQTIGSGDVEVMAAMIRNISVMFDGVITLLK